MQQCSGHSLQHAKCKGCSGRAIGKQRRVVALPNVVEHGLTDVIEHSILAREVHITGVEGPDSIVHVFLAKMQVTRIFGDGGQLLQSAMSGPEEADQADADVA